MKRWLSLLAVMLFLTGCAAETKEPTPTAQSPQINISTEPTGSYDPDSILEVSTSGSLLVYPLGRADCRSVVPMGNDILLFSGEEFTTLTRLTGESLTVAAEVTLDLNLDPDSPAVQVNEKGITYYDESTRELVFLSPSLTEVSRYAMPADMTGSPALTADRKTVYYCSTDSLRSIDLETGIDKLLKEMSHATQTLSGLHCIETVLECIVSNADGDIQTLFLSTQTGETLYKLKDTISLWTNDQNYFALYLDGAYTELLVGSGLQGEHLLESSAVYSTAASGMELGCAVLTFTDEKENTSRLDCYDVVSGTRTASVTIPGSSSIRGIRADAGNQCIWFLRYDSSYQSDILCRWDPAQNLVEDSDCYLAQRYTAENPDQEGLERCAETASALSEKYGVEILIWTDISACQSGEYALTAEHQVSLIEHSLLQLESALACYPEDFLVQAASATDSGVLKICLVRSIDGSGGSMQYWTDDSACIALCPDENLDRNFHHELFFILENRVLGTCSTYDSWNTLNPDGFSYTLDYKAAEELEDSTWIDGENRAFINLRSMSFPREDRAAIMEYAITSGNEACFNSDTMQQKLHKLCTGIRKAFDLEDSEEIFLWEQYLAEPLNG